MTGSTWFRTLVVRFFEGVTRLLASQQRLLVLGYHRVLDAPDPMYPGDPDETRFRAQMQVLARDFTVLPLIEALERLSSATLPPRAVSVTFDDGYADNYTRAWPVLRQLGLPATVFVASGFLDGGVMFNDCVLAACRHVSAGDWDTGIPELGVVTVPQAEDRSAFAHGLIRRLKYLDHAKREQYALRLLDSAGVQRPRHLMMTREQVATLHAAGLTIGAHTRNHPILRLLDADRVAQEITRGKTDIEAIIGAPVTLFAYPNGCPVRDYGAREVIILRQLGFRWAVTTANGYADRHHDRLQIPRVDAWGQTPMHFAMSLASARRSRRGEQCPVPVADGLSDVGPNHFGRGAISS